MTIFKKQPKLYAGSIEEIIKKYAEKDGNIITLEEGGVGYGLTVCYGENLKTCVITEVYLNSWCSGHKVRFYNEMPKKYKIIIDKKINT